MDFVKLDPSAPQSSAPLSEPAPAPASPSPASTSALPTLTYFLINRVFGFLTLLVP